MINFIFMLIGFLSPNSTNKEQNNTFPQVQQNINTGGSLNNNSGPVGGNSGQLPPPFTQS